MNYQNKVKFKVNYLNKDNLKDIIKKFKFKIIIFLLVVVNLWMILQIKCILIFTY